MRIVILTHNFPPAEGGISTHCYEMARNWAQQDEVWVLAPEASLNGARGEARLAGRVVPMGLRRRPLARLLGSLVSVLALARRVRPQVIYGTHWRNCGVALRMAAWVVRVPFFLAVHGSEVLYLLEPRRGFWRALFRWVARGCRGFVTLGEYQRQILEQLGIEPARIFTSPEGIDLARVAWLDPAKTRGLRARHDLRDRQVILTVGRLVERKGHDMVIRALPEVLREVREVVYLIVGRGPMEANLRALARQLGVADRVIFCGFVPENDLMAYYQASDVFVMPNREINGDTEGFGIVFVEAGACGKPVIGGRSGGAVEVIVDGVTGFLVDPCSPLEIARAITLLLRQPDLAREMGKAGRERVKRRYRYEEVATNIAGFFRRAVGPAESGFVG